MVTTKTYSLQQILAGWIVTNNPSAVRQVLINNSLIPASANPGKKEMEAILNSYYGSNGKLAFLSLLKKIPVNANTSESQKRALANSYAEISSAIGGKSVATYQSASRVGDQSTDKWWNDVIDIILPSSTTTEPPVITQTTKTSPLVIGGLIAGVLLVLGLAYFFIGRRGAA